MSKPFTRKEGSRDTTLKVKVSWEIKQFITAMARSLGLKQSDLAEIWLSMINPSNEELIERVAHIKAKHEAEKLSKTRNALVARIRAKGMLSKLDDMSNNELEALIRHIANRNKKG